ncbi:MAG TPA: hypothetical protein P5530_01370 [Candidatus Diapherotrites archaeon]|nr:hypothetical protein [Candidatus Diapherotrites archaeon]
MNIKYIDLGPLLIFIKIFSFILNINRKISEEFVVYILPSTEIRFLLEKRA